ncbi:MAG: ferric reductase-like transmembrane domain-containing protein [Anaerolineae bacterium]
MALLLRGILWFGLYLFLILLPLLTAVLSRPERQSPPFVVALGVGAGFVGLSLMCLEFALISRIKAAAQAFGEDSLQLFHNLMGMVALGFLIAHPVLLVITIYPANCWLNPFAACANAISRAAALALYALILLVGLSVWRKKLNIKYELWQVTHGLLALFVLIGAEVHINAIGRYTSTPIMRVVWLIYGILVAGLLIQYKILLPLWSWNKTWEVVENRSERGDSRTLILKPVGHDGYSFQPGQFAWLKTGSTPFGPGQHPISMSSAGDVEPGGEVAFTIKNLGDWSGEEVPSLRPGDRIWLDGPHGVFTMDRKQAMGYVFIAGGVGITPLHSMLQTMVEREDVRPVLLFYGGRDWQELTLREELDALSAKLNLKLIYVLNAPHEGWQGETGYVTAEVLRRYLPKQYKRFVYFICGPDPMMDAMEQALPQLGIARESIQTERFAMV